MAKQFGHEGTNVPARTAGTFAGPVSLSALNRFHLLLDRFETFGLALLPCRPSLRELFIVCIRLHLSIPAQQDLVDDSQDPI